MMRYIMKLSARLSRGSPLRNLPYPCLPRPPRRPGPPGLGASVSCACSGALSG